jgi:hypothetical protein
LPRFAASVSLLLALSCDGTEGILVVRGGSAGNAARDGGSVGATGGSSADAPRPVGAGRSPTPGVTWQAQLSGTVDAALDVDVFYLDADFASAAVLSALRAKGKIILCYVSAGTFEPWRDDAGAFPPSTLGDPLANYPREQWLDLRSPEVHDLMRARFAAMASAGCDGVYPSTLDAHLHTTGFDITRADVSEYATFLATEIHAAGMSAGLSAPADLIDEVEVDYDWALAIDCLAASGCTPWAKVRQSGRAVLLVEFGDASDASRVCNAASTLGFDAIVKRPAFDAFRVGCPAR